MMQHEMRSADLSCLLCGSKLKLELHKLAIGKNSGNCPMCCELFTVKLNKKDIELLFEAEENCKQH